RGAQGAGGRHEVEGRRDVVDELEDLARVRGLVRHDRGVGDRVTRVGNGRRGALEEADVRLREPAVVGPGATGADDAAGRVGHDDVTADDRAAHGDRAGAGRDHVQAVDDQTATLRCRVLLVEDDPKAAR